MSAVLKVNSVTKLDVQADNTTVLDVAFDLIENEAVIDSRRQSFPLTSTQDEIKAQLQLVLDTFNADQAANVKNAELEAANAAADATIAAFTGLTLEAETGIPSDPAA